MFSEKELNILMKAIKNEYDNCHNEKDKDLCTYIKIKLEAQLYKIHNNKL